MVALAAFLPVVAGTGRNWGNTDPDPYSEGNRARRTRRGRSAAPPVSGGHPRFTAWDLARRCWWPSWPLSGNRTSDWALCSGLSMLGNMLIAGSVGAAVPLLLRRVGMDPAVASAVVVTTVTDVFGFLLFLGTASALISLIT